MNEDAAWPSTATSLILRIRRNDDQESWLLFVKIYTPLIFRYCCRRGLQDSDARDVTQEVFKRVFAKIDAFEYDSTIGKFRGWLGKLTRNEIYSFVKRRERDGQGMGGQEGGDTLAQLADDDAGWNEEFDAATYEAALERVRPRFKGEEWDAFLRVWNSKEKPAAVAASVGKKVTWLYKIKYRALELLRAEIAFVTADEPHFQR